MSRFKKAKKKKSKLRMGLYGPSGSGKTLSALRIMRGLVGENGRIAVTDSEHGSAAKYSDRYEFDTDELEPGDKRVSSYIASIQEAAAEGYDGLIIDSLSHAWAELLENVDKLANTKFKGNKWSAWSEANPVQKTLIESILSFPGHIICTMRSKTEWAQEKTDSGKNKPVRVGLAPEQGKGIEYEFDLLMEMSTAHVGEVIKDRTGHLQDKHIEKPGEEMGRWLLKWLDGEVPTKTEEKKEESKEESKEEKKTDAQREPEEAKQETPPEENTENKAEEKEPEPKEKPELKKESNGKKKSLTKIAIEFVKAIDSCQTREEVSKKGEELFGQLEKTKLEEHAKAFLAWRHGFIQARDSEDVDIEEWDPVADKTLTEAEFEKVEQLVGLQKSAA